MDELYEEQMEWVVRMMNEMYAMAISNTPFKDWSVELQIASMWSYLNKEGQ